MKNAYRKNISRTITKSFGRYFAIMSIIALGVGFFSGLKCTKPAMIKTTDDYLHEYNMFDFRLISATGFSDEDISSIENELDGENVLVEGSFSKDILTDNSDGDEIVVKAIMIPEQINTVKLSAGRMPENDNECVVDAFQFGDELLGKTFMVNEDNDEYTKAFFKHDEYTIVGTVYSPIYLNNERGTTSIGNGKLSAFVYMPADGLNIARYNDVYVDFEDNYEIYSDEYKDFIDSKRETLTGLSDYLLDRNSNTGYLCFKNDSCIVESVAKVFPVFFFLIAALVCSTTMTRMIDDERGQIGTLRALGYSNGAIVGKYLLYSGSAAIIGCVAGYFAGTYAFPLVIWNAYALLYGFTDVMYYFSAKLLIICVIVALLCSMGTTYLACENELRCMPAELIRPKAPMAGKRIFLERIPFIWKSMKFLYKVTARNVFRFKKRMLMMIIGIAGCTALVLTGLGIGDSVSNIASFQYDEIDVHDLDVSFPGELEEYVADEIINTLDGKIDDKVELYKTSIEYKSDDVSKSVYLNVADAGKLDGFVNLKNTSKKDVEYPGYGEVLLSNKLAEIAGVSCGDEITFSYDDDKTVTLTVSGIYENYVWHNAFITTETYESLFGVAYTPNTMYINLLDDVDSYKAGADLISLQGVSNVNVIKQIKDRVANMMKVMDAIVYLVIGCAGALAFIVLFNLSNINITERQREIATIKVLGFYPSETGSYVFRENLLLTVMGVICGIPLGILLHRFVMDQIKIDMIAFKVVILNKSFVLGILIVFMFLVIVDLVMRRKIEAIDMAESLKSVE